MHACALLLSIFARYAGRRELSVLVMARGLTRAQRLETPPDWRHQGTSYACFFSESGSSHDPMHGVAEFTRDSVQLVAGVLGLLGIFTIAGGDILDIHQVARNIFGD